MMGYSFGAGGLFMGVFMLLFWVFVIAGAVWLALTLARPEARRGSGRSDAQAILEERLARGEIDAEEYRARRTALEEASR